MKKIRHAVPLAILFGFGLVPSPCAAQDGDQVTLQFLSFPRSIDPEPVKLLVGEGETTEVEIPTNELSQTYKVKRMGSWSFVEPTAAGEDGKPAFKLLGSAPALPSPHQLILLVRRGADISDGFDVIPVDYRSAQFGGGKFLFLNAAQVDIGGLVGAQRFAIKPGQHTIIKPEPESPGGRVCHAALYYPKEGKSTNFFSSKWPLSEGARGLIFIYHDPQTNRLRLHTIRDYL